MNNLLLFRNRPTTPRPATTEAVFIAPVDSGPSNGDLLDAILNGHIDDAKALLKVVKTVVNVS